MSIAKAELATPTAVGSGIPGKAINDDLMSVTVKPCDDADVNGAGSCAKTVRGVFLTVV